jgi:hypothetical protein
MNVEGRTGPPGNALIVINGAAAVVVGTSPVADRQTGQTGVQMSWTAMPLKRAVVTTMLAHSSDEWSHSLKVSAAAVDDESCQDNEKHNCGGDRSPVIFAPP